MDAEHEQECARQEKRRVRAIPLVLLAPPRRGEEDERSADERLKLARVERRVRLARGLVDPLYVVAARVFRRYGGPEEGGWWYDWRDVEEVRRAWDWRSMLRAVRELKDAHPTDPRGRGSVLGDGGDTQLFIVLDASQIEALQDTERPRYE